VCRHVGGYSTSAGAPPSVASPDGGALAEGPGAFGCWNSSITVMLHGLCEACANPWLSSSMGVAGQLGVRDVDPGDRLGHVLRLSRRASLYVHVPSSHWANVAGRASSLTLSVPMWHHGQRPSWFGATPVLKYRLAVMRRTATATAVNRRQTCRLLVTGIALSIDKRSLGPLAAACEAGWNAWTAAFAQLLQYGAEDPADAPH